MMQAIVPKIRIIKASPKQLAKDMSVLVVPELEEELGFRSTHLMPPISPLGSPTFQAAMRMQAASKSRPAAPSPLALRSYSDDDEVDLPANPAFPKHNSAGVDREMFARLLQQSSTPLRSPTIGASKPAKDLRKEITKKAHQAKMTERRAIFLAKLRAPPSPSAIGMPKTPPESPGVFHFSFPSPGLESPLAMFDDQSRAEVQASIVPWTEHVDFSRVCANILVPGLTKSSAPPSLDEITARCFPSAKQAVAAADDSAHSRPLPPPPSPATRLPSFLQRPLPSIPNNMDSRQGGKVAQQALNGSALDTASSTASAFLPAKASSPLTPSKDELDLPRAQAKLLNERNQSGRAMLATLGRRSAGAAQKRQSAPAVLVSAAHVGGPTVGLQRSATFF